MPMDQAPNETWHEGMEVIAQYNFQGRSAEDLPFQKGDLLVILRATSDRMWYKACDARGREGMIPANYVQKRKVVTLHAMPWFHGKITRQQAEELLRPREDGLFLIRESSNYPGDYTLCVCHGGKVEHYRILYRDNQLTIDEEGFFKNLDELVKVNRILSFCCRWLHGKITREQTEKMLQPPEDGLFLLRASTRHPGDYTLSVSFNSGIEHYRIKYTGNRFTIDDEIYFNNLEDLVKHYLNDADGLCTRLTRPVTKQGDNFVTVTPDEFKSGGWVIQKHDLHIGESIGKGDFGDVFKGTYKGQAVAIKQLKDKDRGEQSFLQEASVMTSLRHDNLVRLIGVVLSDTIFLVTEFMGKGNLVEYLRSRGRSVITKKDQINFATDTCAAMEYLESKNLVHRDLAARNVLVADDGTSKVSDFGLAKFGDFSQTGQKFPIKWTSPEALRENKFTSKSDMWSFGILLWEIYSFGRVPYPRIPLTDVVMHVERGYRMEAPEGCPPEIYTIMKQAWEIKPEDRPTFKTVLGKLNNLRAVTV